mmetsp:Transcript_6459/g.10041  ORF Transcript_6459/g.10041 Transcript_6459/m.10041 type:complete len:83 (-) Transcript_6459:619-867(-)
MTNVSIFPALERSKFVHRTLRAQSRRNIHSSMMFRQATQSSAPAFDWVLAQGEWYYISESAGNILGSMSNSLFVCSGCNVER